MCKYFHLKFMHAGNAPDGVSLSGCCRLKAPIIGGAGDNHPANPFQNFFALAEGQVIEIVRQMPGEPAPFGGTDIASDVMPRSRPRLMGQFPLEIAIWQAIAALDPGKDIKLSSDRGTLVPFVQLNSVRAIEGSVLTGHGAMEVPIRVSMSAHMINQSKLEFRRIIRPIEERFRKFFNRLWCHASLRLRGLRGV